MEDLKTQSYPIDVFTYIQTYFDRCKRYAITLTAAYPSAQHLCKSSNLVVDRVDISCKSKYK